MPEGVRGKTVRIRRGPAAVTGDENRLSHCLEGWEGAASRVIRKSEDLPVGTPNDSLSGKGGEGSQGDRGGVSVPVLS